MTEAAAAIALNARFAQRKVTGVERVAHELSRRLPQALGAPIVPLRPQRPAEGVRGHAWEQLELPAQFRRTGARTLLSLCNFGPVRVRSQLVLIHDVAPFRHPEMFTGGYGAQARFVQRMLAKRCRIATVSEHSRRELADALRLDAATIGMVPPAVDAPFIRPGPARPGRYALFVGGHDERKNLAFLLQLWPTVHAAAGLTLAVVARSSTSTLRSSGEQDVIGVQWHTDPDDRTLAELYRGAVCVVSPSRYEGFGLPLLEGMACGTPFLSTDTGAARELAADPGIQLLPLDAEGWRNRLVDWADRDLNRLRDAGLVTAQRLTWDASVDALVRCLTHSSE